MTENTIQTGTARDFKRMVESHGVLLNDSNVALVESEPKVQSNLSLVGISDFNKFVQSLGLNSADVAIVTADQLMEMNQEKKTEATATAGRKFKK